MELFYRIHWNWDTVPFDAEHAYSFLNGMPPLADDLSRYGCVPCNGTGEAIPGVDPDEDGKCSSCHGEGSHEADRGYSCVYDPEDILSLPAQFGSGRRELAAARVVEYEGEVQGWGCDGEPLAVPSRVLRVMTWDEFTAEYQ